MRTALTILFAVLISVSTRTADAQDAAMVSAGAEIYAEKCAECHGARMVPTGAGADLRELGPDDRPKFDKTLEEGRGQMPSWDGQFTTEERDQIWAYIRSRARS